MNDTLRPFYFIVVVWGKQFLYYFTNFCIPSLLAPDNIPCLINNSSNKFLICTTREDWIQLQNVPSFLALKKYIEPVFIEISLPGANVSSCQHMGVGHKLATNLCHQHQAYGIALTPDLVLSNGTLASVQQKALQGVQLIYCAALRFSEEPFFQGLLDENCIQSLTESRESLNLSGRQLVKHAIPAMHSQTLTYDFEADYYVHNAPATFIRMPNDGGILLHSLSWCPLLLDYKIVKNHDTKALDTWTMDGDYVFLNFNNAKTHVCTDSDEMMLVSWSPEKYNPVPLVPGYFRKKFPSARRFINSMMLRATLENPLFDPLKVKIFPTPVYWHVRDLTPEWQMNEVKIQKIFTKWMRWMRIDGKIYNQLIAFRSMCDFVGYSQVILEALKGKAWAWKKIFRRLKIIFNVS